MKIGIDIDDTITNTNFLLMKYAFKYNNEHDKRKLIKYNTNNFSEVFGWSYDETNDFFRTYYLDALKEIEPRYNTSEILNNLKKDGHKIVFITYRNDRECNGKGEAYRITSEWMKKYRIPYDEINVDVSDKAKFCLDNKIDIFIDDSIRYCEEVSNLGIRTMMAMTSFNLDYSNAKIVKFYNLSELYDCINDADYKVR